jgi:hypothetical protein
MLDNTLVYSFLSDIVSRVFLSYTQKEKNHRVKQINMELHTDEAIDQYLLGGDHYNPLAGCIMLDYLYAGGFDTLLIDVTYTKGRNFKRTPLGIADAKANFWRMIRLYVYPTHSEVGYWLRDLMRHCIALKDVLSIDAGPMLNPQVMMQGLKYLSGKDRSIRPFDLDTEMAKYTGLLSGGNLRACMRFVLSFVNEGKEQGDITWARLDLLQVLYRHIHQTVVAMREAHHNTEEPQNMIEIEKSQQYKDAFYNDDLGYAGENPFMRYPSTLVALDAELSEVYMQYTIQDRDELTAYIQEPNLSPDQALARYHDIQTIMFYSNVRSELGGNPHQGGDGLHHAVDFVGRVVQNPGDFEFEPNPELRFRFENIEFSDEDKMEIHNYQLIQKIISRESMYEVETPVGFEKTVSEMSFEAWTPDDPAATKKVTPGGTPGETIAVKKTVKKASPADTKAKEEEKSNTVLVIAIVAFVAFSVWSTN